MLVIVVFSMFAPANDDSDPSPTTYNSGSAGTKAAYLVLGELGYGAERWEVPPENLKNVDATKATLILAGPNFPTENAKEVQAEDRGLSVARWPGCWRLERTARIFFLMRRRMRRPRIYQQALLFDTGRTGSAGPGGKGFAWGLCSLGGEGPRFRVSQLCGNDAVVVSYKHGAGEAIWWSSPLPMTNRGLKEDASLKLVLASVGGARPARAVR